MSGICRSSELPALAVSILQVSLDFPVFPGHGPDLLLTFPILCSSSHAVQSGPGQCGVKSDLPNSLPARELSQGCPSILSLPLFQLSQPFPAARAVPCCGMWLEFFPRWNLLVVQGERFKGCLKIPFLLKLIQTDKPGWGKLQSWIFSPERRDSFSFPALRRTALAPRSDHELSPPGGWWGRCWGCSNSRGDQPKAINP